MDADLDDRHVEVVKLLIQHGNSICLGRIIERGALKSTVDLDEELEAQGKDRVLGGCGSGCHFLGLLN